LAARPTIESASVVPIRKSRLGVPMILAIF
jgi:hypothetical protein